ncbi:MAG TPA: hypothetical protein VJU53_14430 [Burkholderiaceae bacterium]|nr:hypothetical protein [Burkholderiaceae bacterium]
MALTWKRAFNRALLSGTCASILSTVALAARGLRETGSALAPINAVSHWYWGDRATRVDDANVKYTVPGYLTHHATSVFWAVFFEKVFGSHMRGRSGRTLAMSAATAAMACFVDYQMTPKRLTPGFEHRLSKASLFFVYTAFAVGLAATELARAHPPHLRRRQRPRAIRNIRRISEAPSRLGSIV